MTLTLQFTKYTLFNALLLCFLCVFCCIPPLQGQRTHYDIPVNVYKVRAGKHGYKPWKLKLFSKNRTTKLKYFSFFTDDGKYNLHSSDQWDWNKGGGISGSLFTNHKNSLMWAFRYDTLNDIFEVCPYAHINGKRIYPGEGISKDNIFKIKTNEAFLVILIRDVQRKKFVFKLLDNGGNLQINQEFKYRRNKTGRLIGSWFGGNRSAPTDLELRYLLLMYSR